MEIAYKASQSMNAGNYMNSSGTSCSEQVRITNTLKVLYRICDLHSC